MTTKVSLYDDGDTILPIDVVDEAIQLCEWQEWPTLRDVLDAAVESLMNDHKSIRSSISVANLAAEAQLAMEKLAIFAYGNDWYGALHLARELFPKSVED